MSGRISFIGAGPGAADLITVRGARRLAEADVVVWSASQVAPECIWENARTDAEMVDSSRLRHEEAVELFRRAERDRLRVVRMHSGDPSLWGEVQDQHDACARMQLEVEVVPGVAAVSAAAASVGRELTNPEVARSVVLARLDGGKAPMPDGAKVRELARHGTTMAVSLAAARVAQLAEELREGGYAEDTPVLVAYKVSLPDEQVLRTTLGELEGTVKQHKLWRNALFLVGRSVAGPRGRYGAEGRGFRRSEGTRWTSEPRRTAPAPAGTPSAAAGTPAGASAGPAGEASDRVPEQRLGAPTAASSESDVAWWAVRAWQDSARGGTRVASRSAAARQAEQRHQEDLFAGESGDGSAETGSMANVVNLNVQRQSRVDSSRPANPSAGSPSDVVFASESASEEPPAESARAESAPEADAEERTRAGGTSVSPGEGVARSAEKADAAGTTEASEDTGASGDDGASGATGDNGASGAAEPASSARSAAGKEPAVATEPTPGTGSSADEPDAPKKATRARSSKSTSKAAPKSSSSSKSGKAASPRRKSTSGKQNQRAGESSGQESGPDSE